MANTAIIDLAKPAGTDHALISVINSNMDKIDAEAGRQRGNFAGTYSTTSGYAVGDYCIYQGNLYRCTTAIGSSGENWTAGHWTQTKAGTELKGLSDQIAKQTLSDWFTPHQTNITLDENNSWAFKCGNVIYIQLFFTNHSSGTFAIGTLSSNCRPSKPIYISAVNNSTENEVIEVSILNSGAVTGYSSVNGKQYVISHSYII